MGRQLNCKTFYTRRKQRASRTSIGFRGKRNKARFDRKVSRIPVEPTGLQIEVHIKSRRKTRKWQAKRKNIFENLDRSTDRVYRVSQSRSAVDVRKAKEDDVRLRFHDDREKDRRVDCRKQYKKLHRETRTNRSSRPIFTTVFKRHKTAIVVREKDRGLRESKLFERDRHHRRESTRNLFCRNLQRESSKPHFEKKISSREDLKAIRFNVRSFEGSSSEYRGQGTSSHSLDESDSFEDEREHRRKKNVINCKKSKNISSKHRKQKMRISTRNGYKNSEAKTPRDDQLKVRIDLLGREEKEKYSRLSYRKESVKSERKNENEKKFSSKRNCKSIKIEENRRKNPRSTKGNVGVKSCLLVEARSTNPDVDRKVKYQRKTMGDDEYEVRKNVKYRNLNHEEKESKKRHEKDWRSQPSKRQIQNSKIESLEQKIEKIKERCKRVMGNVKNANKGGKDGLLHDRSNESLKNKNTGAKNILDEVSAKTGCENEKQMGGKVDSATPLVEKNVKIAVTCARLPLVQPPPPPGNPSDIFEMPKVKNITEQKGPKCLLNSTEIHNNSHVNVFMPPSIQSIQNTSTQKNQEGVPIMPNLGYQVPPPPPMRALTIERSINFRNPLPPEIPFQAHFRYPSKPPQRPLPYSSSRIIPTRSAQRIAPENNGEMQFLSKNCEVNYRFDGKFNTGQIGRNNNMNREEYNRSNFPSVEGKIKPQQKSMKTLEEQFSLGEQSQQKKNGEEPKIARDPLRQKIPQRHFKIPSTVKKKIQEPQIPFRNTENQAPHPRVIERNDLNANQIPNQRPDLRRGSQEGCWCPEGDRKHYQKAEKSVSQSKLAESLIPKYGSDRKTYSNPKFDCLTPRDIPLMWRYDEESDRLGVQTHLPEYEDGDFYAYRPNMEDVERYKDLFMEVWGEFGIRSDAKEKSFGRFFEIVDPRRSVESALGHKGSFSVGYQTPKTPTTLLNSQSKTPGISNKTPEGFVVIVEVAKERLQEILRMRRKILDRNQFKSLLKRVSSKIYRSDYATGGFSRAGERDKAKFVDSVILKELSGV